MEERKALMAWCDAIERRAIKGEDKKMNFLEGKKTYIVAVLYAAVSFLEAIGVVDAQTAANAKNFLLAGGLATLRAGIK